MSDKNILETINELNSNLDINPLFEFVTVMTIVKNKIKKEISETETPNLETLKKMMTFHEKIKNYIDAKLKTDEILDKEKCDLEAFDNLIKEIHEDDFDINTIPIDKVKNIYSCIYEHLSKLEKNILKQIKMDKKKSKQKIEDLIIDKSISDEIEIFDVNHSKKIKIDEMIFSMKQKYCSMMQYIDENIAVSHKIADYDAKIDELGNVNEIVDIMNAYDTNNKNAIEAYSEIYEKKAIMTQLYDETKDLNEQNFARFNVMKKKVEIEQMYDDIIKILNDNDLKDYRLDEITEIKEIALKKNNEFGQIIIDYSKIKNFNEVYGNYIDALDTIKEKMKELFNLVILQNKADEVEKIYDTFSEKSLTTILNEFIELLGNKTIIYLYYLMENVFSYLNKKQKFKYYSDTKNKDGHGKDISNDTDYTITDIKNYNSGNYVLKNKKVNYVSTTTNGNTKIFQLFLIVLTEIASAVIVYFGGGKFKSTDSVLKRTKLIINDPTKSILILGKIQYNKKDYTDAIKKNSGKKLYIENAELVGGNYYYYQKYLKYKNKYLSLKLKKSN